MSDESATTDHDRFLDHRTWPDEGPWVVGIDGSDGARTALDWAVAHGGGRATAIRLVTAWQVPIDGVSSMSGPIAVPAALLAHEAQLDGDLRELAAETRHRIPVPVETTMICGGAASALLDASSDASLLVVGNRGRGGFARLLLGSTSTQCATHASVPTAVIPGTHRPEEIGRLLVGLDGSTNSLAALRWALRFATPGSTVDVTWVWGTPAFFEGAGERYFAVAAAQAEARFERMLDEVIDDVGDGSVTVAPHFVHGTPRAALAAAAEHADLVVVGARSRGAVGAALLGSVTTWMLHHVNRPIVVVPDGAHT